MKKTKVFNQLPNIAGVHFDGFEQIKIGSREEVKTQIENFLEYCKKDAKWASSRVILGEWGEGKTEAYYRYISPTADAHNDYAAYISASTLANCYADENTKKLMDTTPLPPLKLLVGLFCGIRAEAKDEKWKDWIPQTEDFESAEDYILSIFKNILGDYTDQKKIFIFIDEFEELLLNRAALKQIISGIKEAINGQYSLIHEHGKYEGCLHFFISCTPDAYYSIQLDKDTSLIFGGLGRRTNVIELPEIRKAEGIEFLYALLKYSYKNKLPDPLPIENIGIFNLLLRVSQSNLGVLTNLFTNALNRARENADVVVLDYETLLQFLEHEQIFVFGGQTSCIEHETYSRILKNIKDQKIIDFGAKCEQILKLILGELKPFSIDDLANRTKSNKQLVQNAINTINEQIRLKEKIEKTIIKVSKLKEDKTLEDVLQSFNQYIGIDKIRNQKWIQIENYSESLEDFKDRITHYSLKEGHIVSDIFLPFDDSDCMIFFEGISQDKAREIGNMIMRRLRENEPCYLASEAVLFQIFPTPVPRGLEFIRNRELRMKLWREVSRDLGNQYERFMPKSFLAILKESEIFSILKTEETPKYIIAQLQDKKDETNITILFYSINGDIKGQDIDDIHSVLKTRKKIHLVIPLYTGEITPEAQENIINKELGKDGAYLLLTDFHLHPTLAKKIICSFRSSIEAKDVIDYDNFRAICRNVMIEELMFEAKLSDWLKIQEKKGIVITQTKTSAKSLKDFSDALKFFVNFLDQENTPEEIFEKNRIKVLKFRKFGTKTGLLSSDIASASTMKNLSYELSDNGFLKSIDGKFKVIDHPVEARILKILEKETKVSEEDLSNYFIIKSKMKKTFEDIFLNVLEYKGRIKKEKSLYSLINRAEFYNELKLQYDKYDEGKKRLEPTYDHFYVFKDQDENLIMLNEFNEFISGLISTIDSLKNTTQNDIFLQRISLCIRMLRHFNDEIEPAMRGANKEAEKIIDESKGEFFNFEDELKSITENSKKWLSLDFNLGDIKEYKESKDFWEEINTLHKRKYTSNELNEIIEELGDNKNKFKFDKSNAEAYYFNIKVYKVATSSQNLNKKINESQNFIKRIDFELLNDRESTLKGKLITKEISANYKISNKILDKLKSHQIMENVELQSFKDIGLKLKDIEKIAKENSPKIILKINETIESVDRLEDFLKEEKKFLSDLQHYNTFKEKVRYIFDTSEYKQYLSDFENQLSDANEGYNKKAESLNISKEPKNKKLMLEIERMFDSWKTPIDGQCSNFYSQWDTYKEKCEKFIKRVRNILKAVSKKHEIETDELDTLINTLSDRIKPDLNKLNDKISSLEELKSTIRSRSYQLVKQYLTIEETKILEILFSKVEEGFKWTPLEIIVHEMKKSSGVDSNTVEAALKNLIKNGYIKPGVSLAL